MSVLNTKAAAYAAVTVVGVVAAYLIARKLASSAGAAAAAVGQAVNPVSDRNLAYRGVNAVGSAVTGDRSFSLGSWLYDLVNPDYDANAKPAPADERTWYENLTEKLW